MTDFKTAAVVGATGRQGGAVVNHLLRDGWHVRALSRDLESPNAQRLVEGGVEVIRADLDDAASLDSAFEGVGHVFAMTNFWEGAPGPILGKEGEIRQGTALVEAVTRAHVHHVVLSSAAGAFGRENPIAHVASKQAIEARLMANGLPWTILRPTFFMENLIVPWMGIWSQIEQGELALPMPPDRKFQMVSVDDIGALAVLAFNNPETYSGTAFDLAGDECTGQEMAADLSHFLGREVQFTGSPAMIEFLRGDHPDAATMWEEVNAHGTNAFLPGLRAVYPKLRRFRTFLDKEAPRPGETGPHSL